MTIEYNDGSRNMCLNFIKGLACIGVVFIHIMFPGNFGLAVAKISNFAVPIFFMTAGYYLNKEQSDKENDLQFNIKRKLKNILHILIYSILIYTVFSIAYNIKNNSLKAWFGLFKSINVWIKIIIFGDFEILDAGILWFLVALNYSYMTCLILCRFKLLNFGYKFIPILIFARIVICAYVETKGLHWCLKSFFLISGMPYILMGNYILNKKMRINKIGNAVALILAFGAMVFSVDYVIRPHSIDLSQIGVIVFSVAFFIVAVNNSNVSLNQGIEVLGDNYSLYVYVFHILVAAGVDFVFGKFGSYEFFMWIRPIIVVAVSIVLAMIVTKIRNIQKPKHMK